jgi:hypothetical protein
MKGSTFMPVSVKWDNDDKTIICWVFEGNWTWEEYYDQRNAANAEIASAGHRVDMIVDMRTSKILPSGAMTHGKNAIASTPPNLGITVFVGLNTVLRVFYNMFSSLYGRLLSDKQLDTVIVATLDEAYTIIQQRRAEEIKSN